MYPVNFLYGLPLVWAIVCPNLVAREGVDHEPTLDSDIVTSHVSNVGVVAVTLFHPLAQRAFASIVGLVVVDGCSKVAECHKGIFQLPCLH